MRLVAHFKSIFDLGSRKQWKYTLRFVYSFPHITTLGVLNRCIDINALSALFISNKSRISLAQKVSATKRKDKKRRRKHYVKENIDFICFVCIDVRSVKDRDRNEWQTSYWYVLLRWKFDKTRAHCATYKRRLFSLWFTKIINSVWWTATTTECAICGVPLYYHSYTDDDNDNSHSEMCRFSRLSMIMCAQNVHTEYVDSSLLT